MKKKKKKKKKRPLEVYTTTRIGTRDYYSSKSFMYTDDYLHRRAIFFFLSIPLIP
jgi:hypothetical protein